MGKLKEHWRNRQGEQRKNIPEGMVRRKYRPRSPAPVDKVQGKDEANSVDLNEVDLNKLIRDSISAEQFVKKLINSNNPAIQKMVASAIGLKETGEERSYIVKPIVYHVEINHVDPMSSGESTLVRDTSGQEGDPPHPPKPPDPESRSITSKNLFGILAQNLTLTPRE